jgi:hypothetical protein
VDGERILHEMNRGGGGGDNDDDDDGEEGEKEVVTGGIVEGSVKKIEVS